MAGLLFPAYQKFYSAISSLERFEKEQNFFDNISSLDNFFAEYRNITFAIQAALKHTDFFSVYEEKRDKYLTDHWFVNKRNETIKQKPFQLVKQIEITEYFPDDSFTLCTRSFTVEDDIPMKSLKDDMKKMFEENSSGEIFFSAVFSFFEKGTTVDLWDKVRSGIVTMQKFMDEMYDAIGENCDLCNQLREKIRLSRLSVIPKDFLLVDDYVYYPKQGIFERAERAAMLLFPEKNVTISRLPLKSSLIDVKGLNYGGTPFENFAFMHAAIWKLTSGRDLMPAFLIIYDDDTYDLDAFHASIKTTLYRRITDISKKIQKENICQICFIAIYSYISDVKNAPKTSKERTALPGAKDVLVCMSVDRELNEMEYVFEKEALSKDNYLACVMKDGLKKKLDLGERNMAPIIRKFKDIGDRKSYEDVQGRFA